MLNRARKYRQRGGGRRAQRLRAPAQKVRHGVAGSPAQGPAMRHAPCSGRERRMKIRSTTASRQPPHPRAKRTRAKAVAAPTGLAATRRPLYTIGHSTRSLEELIDVLRGFQVARLVDIRSIPRSRTNPQFNLDELPAMLHVAGITHVHLASLGGRRTRSKCLAESVNAGWQRAPFHNYADYAQTPAFREGLRELLDMASQETCAIMCAEAVWWRCHRRIVTDHVLAHGVPVVTYSREARASRHR